eukprot:PhF_6_TR2327/c0_g1_i1/m.4146
MSLVFHYLSAPFRAIVDPDDNYSARIRKVVFTIVLYLTPAVLLIWFVLVYQTFVCNHDLTPASIAGMLTLVPVAHVYCVLPYVWAYKRRPWTETANDVWVFVSVGMVNLLLSCLTTHVLSNMFYLVGFLAIVCRPRRLPLHLAVCIYGYITWAYNVTVFDRNRSDFAFRLDGAHDAGTFEPVMGVFSVVIFLLLLVGCSSVLNEYVQATEKAKNSADMCYQVSEKMLQYDIEGSKKILEEACSKVDDRLRTALYRMVLNLEAFRPHMPEYVWHSFDDNNNNKKEEEEEEEGNRNNVTLVPSRSEDTMSVESINPSSNDSIGNDATSSSIKSTTTTTTIFNYLGPVHNTHAYYMLIDFKGKATASTDSLHDSGGCRYFPKPSAVRQLVNWCHNHAIKSKGTLHSFVGDTIQGTWCFQSPSFKPGLFLARVYDVFNKRSSTLIVSGGLVGGPATSYMAGDRRHAYVLHMGWRDVVHRLYRVARANHAALLDENAFKHCGRFVACRWVDSVPVGSDGVIGNPLKVFEVIREVDGGCVFPMNEYDPMPGVDLDMQVEAQMPVDPVTRAMVAHTEGRHRDALDLLTEADSRVRFAAKSSMITNMYSQVIMKVKEQQQQK